MNFDNLITDNVISKKDMREILEKSNFKLNEEVYEMLSKLNGARGLIGDTYVSFWYSYEIIELNKNYNVSEYIPGIMLFGSNEGDEAFGIDYRENIKFVCVPFIPMDYEEVIFMGTTVDDFFNNVSRLNDLL